MKKGIKFNWWFLFVILLAAACENDSDQINDLPTSASESFDLITKKWDLSDSDIYSSIELTKDTVYVIEQLNSQKTTNVDFLSGKFSISDDGMTITLIGFGKMIIKEISSTSIIIEIMLDGSTTSQTFNGVNSTDEENILAGTTWITGTLNDSINGSIEAKRKFYLKAKFITSDYMEVWDCYYDNTSELNTQSSYSYEEIEDLINENIFTIEPMTGVTRIYKKILPETTTVISESIVGTEWRTGTLIEDINGEYVKFYLKMIVSSDKINVWDCYYDGTTKINTSFTYSVSGNNILNDNDSIVANIDQRAITIEPMPGIVRIFAKQ